MEPRDEPPIVILTALRWEAAPLLAALTGRRQVRALGGRCTAGALAGRPIILAASGMGAPAARRAADWLLRAVRPRAILACGFAGGLEEGLELGHLVLAEEVFEPPAPEGEGPREWEADRELLEAAWQSLPAGLPARRGRLATARTVLGSASRKRDFGSRHKAMAVDMESSGVARAANVHDAPALYARVVIDEAGYDWPLDLGPLITPAGSFRPIRTAAAFLSRPSAWGSLAELQRRTRKAGQVLAQAVEAMVAGLPSVRETKRPGDARLPEERRGP